MTPLLEVVVEAPAAFLSENTRYAHWAAKAELVRAWRSAAGFAARAQMGDWSAPDGRVRVVATIHRTHGRGRLDPTNYAPTGKACLDGLVDSGVLTDDSSRFVLGPDMRLGAPWPRAALVLRLYPDTEGDL